MTASLTAPPTAVGQTDLDARDALIDTDADSKQAQRLDDISDGALIVAKKAQRNFTDPESRIMKDQRRLVHQCYNGQAIVDSQTQVIVAADAFAMADDYARALLT